LESTLRIDTKWVLTLHSKRTDIIRLECKCRNVICGSTFKTLPDSLHRRDEKVTFRWRPPRCELSNTLLQLLCTVYLLKNELQRGYKLTAATYCCLDNDVS